MTRLSSQHERTIVEMPLQEEEVMTAIFTRNTRGCSRGCGNFTGYGANINAQHGEPSVIESININSRTGNCR